MDTWVGSGVWTSIISRKQSLLHRERWGTKCTFTFLACSLVSKHTRCYFPGGTTPSDAKGAVDKTVVHQELKVFSKMGRMPLPWVVFTHRSHKGLSALETPPRTRDL